MHPLAALLNSADLGSCVKVIIFCNAWLVNAPLSNWSASAILKSAVRNANTTHLTLLVGVWVGSTKNLHTLAMISDKGKCVRIISKVAMSFDCTELSVSVPIFRKTRCNKTYVQPWRSSLCTLMTSCSVSKNTLKPFVCESMNIFVKISVRCFSSPAVNGTVVLR